MKKLELDTTQIDSAVEGEIVQGFNYWMDGFWKVIAGDFRQKDHVVVEQHTFVNTGCNCIEPQTEFPVQKTWFSIDNDPNSPEWNRANVSWKNGELIIQADVNSTPCTIKWFNIY